MAQNTGKGPALLVEGPVQVQGPVGTVSIPKGTSTMLVSNGAVTANSLIFLTALSPLPTGQVFWISSLTPGSSFTINLSPKAPNGGVTLGYLIIN